VYCIRAAAPGLRRPHITFSVAVHAFAYVARPCNIFSSRPERTRIFYYATPTMASGRFLRWG
jgi:hypothetical protein